MKLIAFLTSWMLIFNVFFVETVHGALITSLVSYWKLDEASGNRADAQGSNTLTDTNTVLSATGIINLGGDFESATSEYLTIADNASLSITGDLSFSTWVKFESLPASGGNMTFTGKWQETNNNSWIFGLYNNAGTLVWRQNMQNSADVSSAKNLNTSTLSTATWYHIVFVYTASAGTVQVYLNGVSEGTSTGHVTNIKDSTASFELGTNIPGLGGSYLDGSMDEFGLWSKALTSTEVTELYNAGAGLAHPFTSASTSVPQNITLFE